MLILYLLNLIQALKFVGVLLAHTFFIHLFIPVTLRRLSKFNSGL